MGQVLLLERVRVGDDVFEPTVPVPQLHRFRGRPLLTATSASRPPATGQRGAGRSLGEPQVRLDSPETLTSRGLMQRPLGVTTAS